MSDLISRQAAFDALMVAIDDVGILDGDDIRVVFDNLPSAQSELEDKISAIGYTGKEGRIYIGGRLFAVRELPQ